jgi:hypothetical protein
MHQYTGAKDGMRCSKADMGPKTVAKHIRSLMKIPRKEKNLKFGMDMFEKRQLSQGFTLDRGNVHISCNMGTLTSEPFSLL